MTEDEVLSFAASSVPSVWALELLLLLKREAPAGRRLDELVSDLRSSTTAISESLHQLHSAGLLTEEAGVHHYRPASPTLESLVSATETLYRVKPSAVVKAIVASRNETLQRFANSFRLKE